MSSPSEPTSHGKMEVLLARLCRDARTLPVPSLDVSAIERAVAQRAELTPKNALARQRPTRLWQIGSAVAAAALIALVWGHWHERPSTPTVVSERGRLASEAGMDGSLLFVGQQLDATVEDLTIKHDQVAVWRLRVPGRARVVETGARITLALDYGRIDADVVPRPNAEVLAVEVESLRVAVHGTVFSVQRQGDIAEILVKEGSVRLGTTAQRGNTQGQLLTAPARMSVDVRPENASAIEQKPPSRTSSKIDHAVVAKPDAPNQDANDPEPVVVQAARPNPAAIEHTWDQVAATVSSCFAEHTPGDPNVRVSFATQVTVRITPEGKVKVEAFDPPVPMAVLECSTDRVRSLYAPPSELGTVVSRPRVLTR